VWSLANILIVTLLLPISTVSFNSFSHYFTYFYWPLAEPLAGAHGTLIFHGILSQMVPVSDELRRLAGVVIFQVDHIILLLYQLHWLKSPYWIQFKLTILTLKMYPLNGTDVSD